MSYTDVGISVTDFSVLDLIFSLHILKLTWLWMYMLNWEFDSCLTGGFIFDGLPLHLVC